MNLATKLKRISMILMAVALLAAALPGSALAAQSDLVRFTVQNKADRSITIRLYSQDISGPAYYLHVEGGITKVMTPPRGTYDYRLTACGIVTRGELDLNKTLTWVVPQCGDKGGPGSKAPNTQDVGKILKLTKVKLVNDTGHILEIWLHGPFAYVFTIPAGGSETVSIPHGDYTWGHYACSGLWTGGNLVVAGAKTKTFSCK